MMDRKLHWSLCIEQFIELEPHKNEEPNGTELPNTISTHLRSIRHTSERTHEQT